MSAEILRKAASLMRERAEKALVYVNDEGWWAAEPMREALDQYIDDDVPHGCNEDADHIASWHPAVALAVADLLDSTASFVEMYGIQGTDSRGYSVRRSLTVATAYLGEAS